MYARVALARPLKDPLTYAIPAQLAGRVQVGHVVLVPLGRRGAETGYVVELLSEPGFDPAKVKPMHRLLDPEPVFGSRQLAFFHWIAGYYLAPLGMVIQAAVPSQIRARVMLVLEPTEAGVEVLTAKQAEGVRLQVLREVIARPGLTRKGMARRLSAELEVDEVKRASDFLVKKGWASWEERELKEVRGRVQTVRLAVPRGQALERVPRAGLRMRAVIQLLAEADAAMDVREVVAAQGPTARDALKRLVTAGVVERGEREDRDALIDAPAMGAAHPPKLNADQTVALAALTAEGADGAFLLHGVTGSGKTEVFLGAARHTLDRGRQVLVLVPEIGLTPQLVGRFKARFGDEVAVLHSGLTGRERLHQWRRIRAGEARVAVGARSALFAPFVDLGLLVVDEEHDDSYKQDDGVTYNARDLAVVLGRTHGCPVILASATPSLESWFNARQGRYTLLTLPKRATPRPVPSVELVDMTQVAPVDGRAPIFAPVVVQALTDTFAAGGKAIVLYNRRGYATMVQCTSCGGTYECPNCGITMTLHRGHRVVACHYCGLRRSFDGSCPACHGTELEDIGKGTEKVQEALKRLFPSVSVGRMDADTTAVRGAHQRILNEFRQGQTQLLVGTQIVAKGHDFPGVHTAVVVSADHGFRMPDFRAAERTHALLVQMAGRAGRGETPGRVLLQTWKPDHYVLEHMGDLHGFYARELELRSLLRYPPYTRLVLVRLDGVDRRRVSDAARRLAGDLRQLSRDVPVEVLGPAAAALPRLVGRWRFQIIVRSERVGVLRRWLAHHVERLWSSKEKGVRVSWDVDPRSLM